jgi:Asp-tRNA(Asn)/Glu-tRNA(Gln) amidotransferase C subunit
MDIPAYSLAASGSLGFSHNPRGWRQFALALAVLLSGCSVFWISAYDKEAADRTTEISKQVIKFYQDMLALDPDKRKPALSTTMTSREGDVESLMRVHLLKEEARQKNGESIKVAKNMLASWRAFALNHRTGDKTAFGDETLDVERDVMERHLRAAFVAEEAKKMVSSN